MPPTPPPSSPQLHPSDHHLNPKRPRRSYTLNDKRNALTFWLTPSIPNEPPPGRLRHPTLDEVSAHLGIPNSTLSGWRTSDEQELVEVRDAAARQPNNIHDVDPAFRFRYLAGLSGESGDSEEGGYDPGGSEGYGGSEESERSNSEFYDPEYWLPGSDPLWDVCAREHVLGRVGTPEGSMARRFRPDVWG